MASQWVVWTSLLLDLGPWSCDSLLPVGGISQHHVSRVLKCACMTRFAVLHSQCLCSSSPRVRHIQETRNLSDNVEPGSAKPGQYQPSPNQPLAHWARKINIYSYDSVRFPDCYVAVLWQLLTNTPSSDFVFHLEEKSILSTRAYTSCWFEPLPSSQTLLHMVRSLAKCPPATLVFCLFPGHTKPQLASGPLHILLFFPRKSHGWFFWIFLAQFKYHFLRGLPWLLLSK